MSTLRNLEGRETVFLLVRVDVFESELRFVTLFSMGVTEKVYEFFICYVVGYKGFTGKKEIASFRNRNGKEA